MVQRVVTAPVSSCIRLCGCCAAATSSCSWRSALALQLVHPQARTASQQRGMLIWQQQQHLPGQHQPQPQQASTGSRVHLCAWGSQFLSAAAAAAGTLCCAWRSRLQCLPHTAQCPGSSSLSSSNSTTAQLACLLVDCVHAKGNCSVNSCSACFLTSCFAEACQSNRLHAWSSQHEQRPLFAPLAKY